MPQSAPEVLPFKPQCILLKDGRFAAKHCGKDPVVSIITPVYNPGSVLSETIDAVLGQSLQQWEWILVDDGSTCSATLEILERLAGRNDPRVCILTQPNAGPGASRNRAVQECGSSYIYFLDADDLMEPTTLEKLLWFMHTHPTVSMARGLESSFGAENFQWDGGFHSGKVFLDRNCIQTSAMVRREAFVQVEGFDASIRGGFEDWDFWLRLANAGCIGATVFENLHWYRRRADHSDRWADFSCKTKEAAFREQLMRRYPKLWEAGNFPEPLTARDESYEQLTVTRPGLNLLVAENPRLLLLLPHMELGGADKFNLDVIQGLSLEYGWEVTVVCTLVAKNEWEDVFLQATPDVHVLNRFLPRGAWPEYLDYLIESRGIQTVLIGSSSLAYQFTPRLKQKWPQLKVLDYLHIEEPEWRQGGYPRYSANYTAWLDGTAVTSEHLKRWVVERGVPEKKVEVIHIGVNPDWWSRTGLDQDQVRAHWSIPQLTTIIYPCRFCDQKQPRVFMQVILELKKRGLEFVALAVGDGPDRAWMEEFCMVNSLMGHVIFTGSVAPVQIRELMSVSDLCFIPSTREGIALVYFEAMAMGVVPVGADVGGQSDLVQADCGVLLSRTPDEVKSYSDAIQELIIHPDQRRKMSESSRSRIMRHFDFKLTLAKLNNWLRGPLPNRAVGGERELIGNLTLEAVEMGRLNWAESNLSQLITQGGHRKQGWSQLYLPEKNTHSESASVKVAFQPDEWVCLKIPLKKGVLSEGRLRWDPVSESGICEIKRLVIRKANIASEQPEVWCFDSKSNLNECQFGGDASLSSLKVNDSLLVLSCGTDPWLLLPDISCPGEATFFEASFRFSRSHSEIVGALRDAMKPVRPGFRILQILGGKK